MKDEKPGRIWENHAIGMRCGEEKGHGQIRELEGSQSVWTR